MLLRVVLGPRCPQPVGATITSWAPGAAGATCPGWKVPLLEVLFLCTLSSTLPTGAGDASTSALVLPYQHCPHAVTKRLLELLGCIICRDLPAGALNSQAGSKSA